MPGSPRFTRAGFPNFRVLRRRVEQDKAAVQAGLTLPISNGQVEGQVTKIKLIKRMMYGRAEFPLLRKPGLTCPLTRPHDQMHFFGHTVRLRELWHPFKRGNGSPRFHLFPTFQTHQFKGSCQGCHM